jgi:hypothetical protein
MSSLQHHPERALDTDQLRMKERIVPQGWLPRRWLLERQPTHGREFGPPLASAWRGLPARDAAEVRAPTTVGPVRRVGGHVVEQRADRDVDASLRFGGCEMFPNPAEQLITPSAARGDSKNGLLSLAHGCGQLEPVQYQKRFESGMADAFIAVDEWMVVDERESDRGGFRLEVRVEVLASERCAWLGDG